MRRIRLTAFLLLVAVVRVSGQPADSASASMRVSVEVVARTILTVDRIPAEIRLTADDIARGFVDVPEAVAFRIRSNASNGYALQFEPVSYPFTRARVAWDSRLAVVSADGSWLTRPYTPGEQAGTFTVRLDLARDAEPGSYAWPVHFDATSL